ncbi:hypothetical protein FRC14_002092 [Serendipita sp. 396]|nr:hypothetical protein FRC14_002092 [Serendipita sp. 396]
MQLPFDLWEEMNTEGEWEEESVLTERTEDYRYEITVREVYQFWRLEEPIKGLRDSRTIPLFIIQDGLTIRLHEEIWDKMRENRAFTFVFFRPDPQSAQPQLLPQSISAPAAQSAMMTMMMTSAVRRSPRPRNDNGGDWLLGYGDMNVREKV